MNDDRNRDERPWERWLVPASKSSAGEPPCPEPPQGGAAPACAAGAGRTGGMNGERAAAVGPGYRTRIWTVGDVTRAVREALRSEPELGDLWVEGEVGQVTVSAAGHCYFALRDGRAQLACVFFRARRMASPFEPRTGLRVVARGRLDVYEAAGTYQLYVESVQPAGFGDLGLRFEALKAQLLAEGLFDPGRRRPIPVSPRLIGVATSTSGAVLHDILHVLRRRWPLVRVVVAPCQVQGEAAPPTIVTALERLGRWRDPSSGSALDVLILARGGGSLQDLWAFNDERVVRAVAASPVPVVTGVGHETDVTLVDFAADLRAPTPSAAAELVVPSQAEAAAALRGTRGRLQAAALRGVQARRAALQAEHRALLQLSPETVLAGARQRTGDLLDRGRRALDLGIRFERTRLERAADRLFPLVEGHLARARSELSAAAASMAALSPYATLERGYAIVRGPSGGVLTDAAQAAPGDALNVRLARGALGAIVRDVRDSA